MGATEWTVHPEAEELMGITKDLEEIQAKLNYYLVFLRDETIYNRIPLFFWIIIRNLSLFLYQC